ncbi:acetate kinase [Candidatus Berkelbacteria bacterium CG08_land_8_20_14_0_20_39_8]|uniref:Acetate kinase n=1 Tax=Candidatus Berkelbacteria bacterium CG08_land_8_20_14_0_20_39_8 TaxID=1974511 RepID=A0A2M6YBX7_9BACT|nr:MAG: acetate kinase [Candidatus Berkelbacteria bacterium CG08_land_8_20_14_0_20_39_8]
MILVINPGSSSIKYKLFDSNLEEVKSNKFGFSGNISKPINQIIDEISNYRSEISKIGYRVVHGGHKADEVMPVNLTTIKIIEEFSSIAPHHNPPAIAAIKMMIEKMPAANHFSVFDTAFFKDLPEVAKTYSIDKKIADQFGILRYGFHGISHKSMTEKFDPQNQKKLITFHLGAGASAAAVKNGQPVDTSMGFTPIEGLVMQIRSGDIDPEIIIFLAEKIGLKRTKDIIENYSGLAGISQTSGDMLQLLEKDDQLSKLAIDIFCYRAKKYLGAYAAVLGGVDIIVFSGEIGFGSALIRKKITSGLSFLNFETKFVKPNEELAIAKKLL